MGAIIFETHEFDFPIILKKLGETRFRVVYGEEANEGDYDQSCANLGKAIMHAASIR